LIGYKYSFAQLAYDAFLYLFGVERVSYFWIDLQRKKFTCSELIGEGLAIGAQIYIDGNQNFSVLAPQRFCEQPFIRVI